MAFAMRINFVDVVVSDTLKNVQQGVETIGYQFDIRLSYYRGHFLSVIDEFWVTVDEQRAPDSEVRFRLNGKDFGVHQLEDCITEWWDIMTPATVFVRKPGGLPSGEHSIDVHLMFRSPYMAIGPNHQYMPVDNCGAKKMYVRA
jgi:hypothetical protein